MGIIKRMLKEKAVYWNPGPPDGYGQSTYGTPVEIKVRWQDIAQVFVSTSGREETSAAVVYVDRDLLVSGVLWHGELTALTSTSNPFANPGAWEIRRWSKVPKFNAKEFIRTAHLGGRNVASGGSQPPSTSIS